MEEILERIGLTKNESKIYLTLLKIGTSRVSTLLKKSGLNSGKIYDYLESLQNKGLVSESVINNVRHFSPAPPKRIRDYLQIKKEQMLKEEQLAESLIRDLEPLRKVALEEPRSVTYTGYKGFQTAVEEAFDDLEKGDEILAMGVTELKDKKLNDFWKRWSNKRIRSKIKARMIFSEASEYYSTFKRFRFTDSRVLEGITPVAVDVFGKKTTLILNYAEPLSVTLIKSENTAQSFREFFEQLWKQAK